MRLSHIGMTSGRDTRRWHVACMDVCAGILSVGFGFSALAIDPKTASMKELFPETPAAHFSTPTASPQEQPASQGEATREETAKPGPRLATDGAGANPIFTPGDLLRLSMDEDATVTYDGPVSAAGTIAVPYLGEFPIAGLTPETAAASISAALSKDLYQKATIMITLTARAPGKVYVYGAVRKPGVVQMPQVGDLTITQVVSYVDGLTSWAAPEDAYVLRRTKPGEGPQKIPLNLADIFTKAVPFSDRDIVLKPDDVVCVPGVNNTLQFTADTCEVIVVGEVNVPGIVRFAPGEQRTLMRAIFKAGGFSKFAKGKAVRVIRYGKNRERTEKVVDANRIIDEGFLTEDVELTPGDMLIVPQKAINF